MKSFWFKQKGAYFSLNNDDKCRSIKYAVEWGNLNTEKVIIFRLQITFSSQKLHLLILKNIANAGTGNWKGC